jgi:methylmalonyl-CoA/ethylmalonyl-CoA epimerase
MTCDRIVAEGSRDICAPADVPAKWQRRAGRAIVATKGVTMAKLRHIAIIVPDPEAAAKFFEQAFDMKRAGTARRGIYMSDGTINVALLKKETDKEKIGIYHFGMWVDDLDAAEKKVVDAGGTYLAGRPTSASSFYEAKYKDPLGIVFDLTHTGWAGAVKDVVAK